MPNNENENLNSEDASPSAAAGSKTCCYEATTVVVLRIIELMRSMPVDADIIQGEFIGEIGDYEIELAKREGIEIKF